MAKKVNFSKRPKRRKKKGGAVDFPFGANVAGGKKRRGGFGGGS
jgi:hypothetical protein